MLFRATGDHHHLGRLALVGENVETGALGGIGALAEPAVAGDTIIDAIHATSGIAGKEGWQAAIATHIPHSYGTQPHPARHASADRKSVVEGKSVSVRVAPGGRGN